MDHNMTYQDFKVIDLFLGLWASNKYLAVPKDQSDINSYPLVVCKILNPLNCFIARFYLVVAITKHRRPPPVRDVELTQGDQLDIYYWPKGPAKD